MEITAVAARPISLSEMPLPLPASVIDGGPRQKTKDSLFLAAIKCHAAAILHKLAMSVVKKTATAIHQQDRYLTTLSAVSSIGHLSVNNHGSRGRSFL